MRSSFRYIGVFPDIVEVSALAYGEIDLDRVNRGHSREQTGLPHEVANLCLRDAGNAVNQRDDFGKAQIELSRIHLGLRRIDLSFGCPDCSLGGEIGLDGIVEILLA